MRLTVSYFAWLRERIGAGEEKVDLPGDIATIDQLTGWLSARSDGHAAALADRTRIRAAIDGRYVAPDAALVGATEVSLFPPVTGG
jgi:sulfur-carrier protein